MFDGNVQLEQQAGVLFCTGDLHGARTRWYFASDN